MAALDLASIREPRTSGVLHKYEIPGLLVGLARQSASGRLTLQHGAEVRTIGFAAGRPVMVASNIAAERFGSRLLEQGTISITQMAEIDGLMTRENVQFGAAMLRLNVMGKDELVAALGTHRAYLLERSVGMQSAQLAFDPDGKVSGEASGLRVLAAIEQGLRSYAPAEIEEIQAQLQNTRFTVPAEELALAHQLGGSAGLEQLLQTAAGAERSLQEMIASSEDDNPELAVLTLVLAGLLVAQEHSAARPVAQQAASDAELDALLAPSPAPAPTPARRQTGTASRVDLKDVDDFLSGINPPAAAASVASRRPSSVPIAPPADPLSSSSRTAPVARRPSSVPARRPSAVPAQPSTGTFPGAAASVPRASFAPTPDNGPGMSSASRSGAVSQRGSSSGFGNQTGSGVHSIPGHSPKGPGGEAAMQQSGVPDAVYALVPREFLNAVGKEKRKSSRVGLYLVLAGAVLVVGLGGGAGAVWLLTGHNVASLLAKGGASVETTAPKSVTATPKPAAAVAQEPAPSAAVAPSAPPATPAPAESAEPPKAKAGGRKPQDADVPAKPPEKARPEEPARHAAEPAAKPAKAKAAQEPAAAAGGNSEEIAFRLNIAAKLLQEGNHRKALGVCQEILGMDPRNAQAYRTMGIAYSSLGAKPQACESYRRYLRFAPSAPDKAQIEALLQACQ